MTQVSYQNDLELALKLADLADQVSLARFQALDLKVETKPDRTPVTDADKAVESAIRGELSKVRPNDQVIGEEFENTANQNRSWIIDPIDGTANYLRGVPIWGTLIALREGDEVVVGVASAPAIGRRWWGAKGLGAHTKNLNGQVSKLAVSKVSNLEDSYFSYNSMQMWDQVKKLDNIIELSRKIWRNRAFGDFYSYMLLAEGVIDAVAENDLKVYDWSALKPIVEEAGGKLTGIYQELGAENQSVLATNALLHDAYLEILKR